MDKWERREQKRESERKRMRKHGQSVFAIEREIGKRALTKGRKRGKV